MKEAVLNEKLSEGHARALLGLSDKSSLSAAASIVIRRNLSVRDTEQMVRKINYGKGSKNSLADANKEIRELAQRITKSLGYTANITKLSNGGKITIRYNNNKELEDIIGKISTGN